MSPLSALPVTTLDGRQSSLGETDRRQGSAGGERGQPLRMTPQYRQLEALHRQFGDRGFTVLGFPTNQFAGQEPGSAEQLAEFCSATYGVTFPMSDIIDVNGAGRDPIYTELKHRAGWGRQGR